MKVFSDMKIHKKEGPSICALDQASWCLFLDWLYWHLSHLLLLYFPSNENSMHLKTLISSYVQLILGDNFNVQELTTMSWFWEKSVVLNLLSLRVFSTNVNQCPKFVLTSCPFCCCFNLVLMWQRALKNKLKNALTDSPKLSFKSHFVPITLFWDKQSSWHLPPPLALICVP
jgi:hypothetical protein